MNAAPTDICLTIDTEFSINGAFARPDRCKPLGEARVYCPVDGEDQGLGFLLRTLGETGLHATFFVETAHVAYFGDRPMGGVVETLLQHGQDVQLHLHPCWRTFEDPDWQERIGDTPPLDQSALMPRETLCTLFDQGMRRIVDWGAPRPLALRTGNLSAGPNVYAAMADCGLPIGSNVAFGYAPPADPSLRLMGGVHPVGGVVEVPVLSYLQLKVGRWSKRRMLAITAASWPETKALLLAARAAGISPVVILTHPFEFIKSLGGRDRINRINQQRLRKLCTFIADNPTNFRAATFGADGERWRRLAPASIKPLQAPLGAVLGRMVINALNDRASFL
ncbi:MAG: polysaccharide deacetylase [Geminicoccaceae bacterium]